MAVKRYNPKQIAANFGPTIITGFMDGTFLSVEYNNDLYSVLVGSDGLGTRSKSNDESARATFTLVQSAATNDLLSAQFNADRLSPAGIVHPLGIKDLNGNTLCAAETAWIVQNPVQEFANEVSPREWIIETDKLDSFVGGNI